MAKKLSARHLVRALKEVLAERLPGFSPRLTVVYSSDFSSAASYAHSQAHHMSSLGVEVRLLDVAKMKTLEVIRAVENEVRCGSYVSVLRPLPADVDYHAILDIIPPYQDAEGVTWRTLAGLVAGDFRFGFPLTPWSAILLPLAYGFNYRGEKAVVIGRSPTVGMPLGIILSRLDATVTILHSKSGRSADLVRSADFVFVAVGKPRFLTPDMVSEKAIVVDIGYHPVEGGAVGDVSEKVYQKVRAYTPVPGGVGALTTILVGARILRLEMMKRRWAGA